MILYMVSIFISFHFAVEDAVKQKENRQLVVK